MLCQVTSSTESDAFDEGSMVLWYAASLRGSGHSVAEREELEPVLKYEKCLCSELCGCRPQPCVHTAAAAAAIRRWLQLRFDCDSTVVRLPFDCSSTALRPIYVIRPNRSVPMHCDLNK